MPRTAPAARNQARPRPPLGGQAWLLAALAAALLAGVGVRWARGDEPARLPAGIVPGAFDPDTARLQRAYRKLVELELHEEADDLARRLGERPAAPPHRQATADRQVRTVSLRPASPTPTGFPATRNVRWDDCRTQRVSFKFAGASAAEVAKFVHEATGLAVRAIPGSTPAAGFHGDVRRKPLEEALLALGVTLRHERAGLALAPPLPVALRTAGVPDRR